MAKAILILATAVVVAGAAVAGWNHLLNPDTLRDTAARMEERAAELRGEQTRRTAANAGSQEAWAIYDAQLDAAGRTDVATAVCEGDGAVGLFVCYGYDAEGRFVHSTGIRTDDYQPTPATLLTLDERGLGEDWAGKAGPDGESLRSWANDYWAAQEGQ